MDTPAPSELYKHKPLPERSFRLLRIRPDSQPGDIRIRVAVHNIDACPPYTALSCTWGEPGNEKCITMSGKRFLIRQNLADFLDTVTRKRNEGLENYVRNLF